MRDLDFLVNYVKRGAIFKLEPCNIYDDIIENH